MNAAKRIVFAVFCACTALFLAVAAVLVALQVAGLVSVSGPLITGASDALMPWALYFAIGMGITGFVHSYLVPQTDDQD